MKESTRNITIGLTVIIALAMLAGMILIFTGAPEMFQLGDEIKIQFPGSAGANEGDPIHLAGLRIGTIVNISFTDGDPRKGVTFVARIDRDKKIPGNVEAIIHADKGLVGGAYVELCATGPERIDKKTGKPYRFLPRDWKEAIGGQIRAGLVPPEMTEAMQDLSRVAKTIEKMLTPPAAGPTADSGPAPPGEPAPAPMGLYKTLTKINRTLDDLHAVVGDPHNQANIKTSLANLAKATQSAQSAMNAMKKLAEEARGAVRQVATTASKADRRIDELAGKLTDSAEKISVLMATINRAAMKMESGKGTAGKLINDPKLYNSLLQATKQLTGLLEEFRELVKLWKERGVQLKLQ